MPRVVGFVRNNAPKSLKICARFDYLSYYYVTTKEIKILIAGYRHCVNISNKIEGIFESIIDRLPAHTL